MEFIVKNGIYVDAREINNAITNAPAIEQGEPVGYVAHMHELNDEWMSKLPIGTKLYTAPPPQPQTVKDALEKAAKICDDRAKYMKEMIMQDVVVGKADTGAMVCANAIRALIEKE